MIRMGKKYALLLFSIGATIYIAGCSAVFTNDRAVSLQDVIYLSKHELSNEVIMRHIEATNSRFDLTTDDLIMLKDEGVNDEVIAYMIERTGPQPPFASEYERPAIPGMYNVYYPPLYYDAYRYQPLFEMYSDYYSSPQSWYLQPVRRRSGLVGRFYEYGPEALSEGSSERRDVNEQSAPVERSEPANKSQNSDESE